MHYRFALLALLLAPSFLPAQDVSKYPPPAQVKAAFLKLLDRPKVPLDAKILDTKDDDKQDGWQLDHLTIASEKKADGQIERVPMIVLRPAKMDKKLPAVIVLHGTGGSMRSQLAYMRELAKHNIIGVAIDARYHGERLSKGSPGYVAAITRAWQTKAGEPMEHPFYYDTCWDLWRTADYLSTRPDVDAKKLGMIGFSMGGIETWLAAAVDERIKVSVPAIGVQSFRWSLEHDKWQGRANTIKGAHLAAAKDLDEPMVNQKVCRELWGKVIPGILDQFDCPSMLRLFAGRELMILNGTKDANCPIEGARIAIAAADKAFKDAGASDHLSVIVEEVGHTVTAKQRQASLEWFDRWLK